MYTVLGARQIDDYVATFESLLTFCSAFSCGKKMFIIMSQVCNLHTALELVILEIYISTT